MEMRTGKLHSENLTTLEDEIRSRPNSEDSVTEELKQFWAPILRMGKGLSIVEFAPLLRKYRKAEGAPNGAPAAPNGQQTPNRQTTKHVKKRSTEKGEARSKIIAALTSHHKYEEGSVLNTDPIGVNELARMVLVSGSTASEFFKDKFGSHANYRAACGNPATIANQIKLLRNEFAPSIFYKSVPVESR